VIVGDECPTARDALGLRSGRGEDEIVHPASGQVRLDVLLRLRADHDHAILPVTFSLVMLGPASPEGIRRLDIAGPELADFPGASAGDLAALDLRRVNSLGDGPVCLISHESGSLLNQWPSIAHFLDELAAMPGRSGSCETPSYRHSYCIARLLNRGGDPQ
jgi:hypothetical protein